MKLLSVVITLAVMLSLGVACGDDVTFTYQGRVKVQGHAFSGTGYFKFAILNTSGTATLWSNDGNLDSEPSSSVELPVEDGVFSVTVGDSTLGMTPINSAIFTSRTPLKLRVWFSDTGSLFEQLMPDQNLADLTLNTGSTGTRDFTIYVDGATGNDANNGLSLQKAKKTIQAAIEIIPPQVRCNITVKIMPGVYREAVRMYGITAAGTPLFGEWTGNFVRIVGDEDWTTSSLGNPNVRITACDNDDTHRPLRNFCFDAHNCSSVQLEGLLFDYATYAGANLQSGAYIVKNCKASNCVAEGFRTDTGAFAHYIDCTASDNVYHGFYQQVSSMWITGGFAHHNGHNGVFAQGPGYANIYGGLFEYNGTGVAARDGGFVGFFPTTPKSTIRNNVQAAIGVVTSAFANGVAYITYSGTISTSPGGTIYY